MRIPVDIRKFPWIRKLAADYAFSFSSLAPFFAGDPAAASSWAAAIERAQRHPRQRAAIVSVLEAQQAGRDAPGPARQAAAQLADPKSVAILTGQQAGLFGGPAYSLYKAISAIKLARQIQAEHNVPAVPIFWVESEDHDWDEVASCAILDGDFQRRTVQLAPPPGAGHTSVGFLQIGDDVNGAIEEIGALLPPTEFTEGLLADLRAAYQPGRRMGDAFARLLERLLGNLGLVVYECSDASAKAIVGDIFLRELRNPGRTWQLAGEAGEQLVASGYHAQVTGSFDNGAALFHIDGVRSPIDPQRIAEFEAEAQKSPSSFSPNVLLRPVVEDTLFPTICYVSGPNELAYLAQLKRVYEQFGVPMPLLYPRLSATVLDAASAKFLSKHDIELESLHARDEALLNRLLAASLPASVEQALQDATEAIGRTMAALIAAVPAIDPTLEGAAKSTQGKLEHDLTTLRGKIISAAKKRDDTLRRQFTRAQSQAFPDGSPQERAIGGISLLNRYGPALIEQLTTDVPLDLGHHWVLTI